MKGAGPDDLTKKAGCWGASDADWLTSAAAGNLVRWGRRAAEGVRGLRAKLVLNKVDMLLVL